MKRNPLFTVAIVLTGLGASFLMALGSEAINENFHVLTPGMLVWYKIVVPAAATRQAASLADFFEVQLSVDTAFWFVAMALIYFAMKKVGPRLLGSR